MIQLGNVYRTLYIEFPETFNTIEIEQNIINNIRLSVMIVEEKQLNPKTC